MKRVTLLAIGLAAVLLLAACGSLAAGVVETGPVEPAPEPTTAATATSAEPQADPTATEEKPTVAPTAQETASETEKGAPAGDNRPARLRAATSDWNTNWDLHSIDYGELLSGGPPRDGIPSIDEPRFVNPDEAADWLAGNEPVIALEIGGDARAYPLQILTWHEIANDTVGDVPVAVTFCPLCNSAITFDRRLNGEVYEFGTSGLLRNSDLVMYDRTTESLWQQLTGEAIIGDLTGERLAFLPSSLVSFADFQAAYPDGVVLSQDTGYNRSYGRNPYTGYDTIGSSPFLFDGEKDPRLPAMERVVTVPLGDLVDTGSGSGQSIDVAYPLSVLSELGVINDTQGGYDLVVLHEAGTSSALGAGTIAEGEDVGATGVFDPNLDGQKLTFVRQGEEVVDEETGSTWSVLGQAIDGPLAGENLAPLVHGDHFWFAWAAFKPDTIVYQAQ